MNSVAESLYFFSRVSAAFHTSAGSLWSKYPDSDRDPWDALGIFLEGYAFERQGRNPAYAHVAADVVKGMKEKGVPVADPDCPRRVWARFLDLLETNQVFEDREGEVKPNEKVNPLCPKLPRPSAITVAAHLAQDSERPTVTAFAKQCLKSGSVEDAYRRLDEINGIGPKIACLFLRDIAAEFAIRESAADLRLQPVDIHVRRISRKLMARENSADAKAADDKKIAKWIVERSQKTDLNPLNVNSGMWHFGSLIAGSAYRAGKALDDLSCATRLVDTYMARQSQVAGNWLSPEAKGKLP